jgi:serine/threonine protein phosphatase 1
MFGKWFGRSSQEAARPPIVASAPPGHRVYVIGDIHGRLDLLQQLHGEIRNDRAALGPAPVEVVVYLGDYIDRGAESAQVIDYLIADPLPDMAAVHLLGNHDEALLRFLDDAGVGPTWAQFGGESTLLSYGVRFAPDKIGMARWEDMRQQLRQTMPQSHVDFLRNCDLSAVAGDYFFCHAGVRPGVPVDQQSREDLLWIRDAFLSSTADHGKFVIHGHTPTESPDVRHNRIGVDTGAFASGVLTAVVLEGQSRRFLCTGAPAWAREAAQ